MLQSIQSVLASPAAYNLWWRMIGGPAWARVLVTEYVRPTAGARILEIGCGPGTIAAYLLNTDYVGFDISSKYIERARMRFPQARFVCASVSQFTLPEKGYFDVVLAIGIVHHLDDQEATQLFQIAYDALKPGGKLVSFDGVFTDDQSPTARWLLAKDRGEYVRSEPEYVKLASQLFNNVRSTVHHNLLRIPYTHLILECIRG
jgi:SAM-dependent methyltransferase